MLVGISLDRLTWKGKRADQGCGQLHAAAILTRTGSRPTHLNVLSCGGSFPAYTFTTNWPLSGIERTKRTTSPGKARLLPFPAGLQRSSTGGSSLSRYTTLNSPSKVCFQEPAVEIISSVRLA